VLRAKSNGSPSTGGSDKENEPLNNVHKEAPTVSPVELTAHNKLHMEKNNRRIRFMSPLEQRMGSCSPYSPDSTLSPPPKEFVRSSYRTMRAGRCLSAVVTERDLAEAAVAATVASPRPPAGIVQQMKRLYSGGSGGGASGILNRSGSFGSSSPEDERPKKSSGLFRSRSWSFRRRQQRSKAEPPKRCSPGGHSQDSGISTESRSVACGTDDDDEKVVAKETGSPTRKALGEREEEEEDPNLTQVPSSAVGNGGVASTAAAATAATAATAEEGAICRYRDSVGKRRTVSPEQAKERLQVPHSVFHPFCTLIFANFDSSNELTILKL